MYIKSPAYQTLVFVLYALDLVAALAGLFVSTADTDALKMAVDPKELAEKWISSEEFENCLIKRPVNIQNYLCFMTAPAIIYKISDDSMKRHDSHLHTYIKSNLEYPGIAHAFHAFFQKYFYDIISIISPPFITNPRWYTTVAHEITSSPEYTGFFDVKMQRERNEAGGNVCDALEVCRLIDEKILSYFKCANLTAWHIREFYRLELSFVNAGDDAEAENYRKKIRKLRSHCIESEFIKMHEKNMYNALAAVNWLLRKEAAEKNMEGVTTDDGGGKLNGGHKICISDVAKDPSQEADRDSFMRHARFGFDKFLSVIRDEEEHQYFLARICPWTASMHAFVCEEYPSQLFAKEMGKLGPYVRRFSTANPIMEYLLFPNRFPAGSRSSRELALLLEVLLSIKNRMTDLIGQLKENKMAMNENESIFSSKNVAAIQSNPEWYKDDALKTIGKLALIDMDEFNSQYCDCFCEDFNVRATKRVFVKWHPVDAREYHQLLKFEKNSLGNVAFNFVCFKREKNSRKDTGPAPSNGAGLHCNISASNFYNLLEVLNTLVDPSMASKYFIAAKHLCDERLLYAAATMEFQDKKKGMVRRSGFIMVKCSRQIMDETGKYWLRCVMPVFTNALTLPMKDQIGEKGRMFSSEYAREFKMNTDMKCYRKINSSNDIVFTYISKKGSSVEKRLTLHATENLDREKMLEAVYLNARIERNVDKRRIQAN